MDEKWLLCPSSNNNGVLGSIPAVGSKNQMRGVVISSVMLMHTFQTQQSNSSRLIVK